MNKHAKADSPKQATNMFVFDESGIKSAVHISHASNVQIGSGNVMVINPRKSPTVKSKHRPEPSITACIDIITDEDIDAMEQYLGRNWRTVARKLGFEDGETDIIEHDYQGLREQIHQMLRTWKDRKEANATVGSLAKAIFSVQECASVVKYLEKNHPSGSAKNHPSGGAKSS